MEEDDLSTDAIGIPSTSEPGDVLKQDETSNTPEPSESVITLTSHETGSFQTNNQCQSETLNKPFQSEVTYAVRNDNKLLSSDELQNHDDRTQNVQNACELGHPTLSDEFEVNSESTEPKIKPTKEVKQTHDKNVLDQALSNLKLPSEHLGTHETCCPQRAIQSQFETLENTFQSVNTNVIRDENNLHSNHNDRRQNMFTAVEFRHDHPKMSKEFEIHSESTIPKIKSQEEVGQTYDKNALDQAPSNLRLPPEPPLEWRLNELLDDIAMEITDSEFKRIKLLFTGPESLGKALLEECDTCIKLFTVLKEKKYISRDNILYLNKILYILMRKDLIKRTVEYCLQEGNVIHYYSFDGEPGIGKRYVKIHVVADIQYYNKEALEQLRNYVARIVCAPNEVVEIYAVEPGSSLLITFTMPDIYVDVLKDLLQQKVNLLRLSTLQVDIVIVDGIHYDLSGQAGEEMLTGQYKEIRNVYEQLNDTRKELEQLEITHFRQQEGLKDLKRQFESTEQVNHKLSITCSMLHKMQMTCGVTEAALNDFQSLMQEASEKCQDMGLIKKIIKSNTEITAVYHQSLNDLKRKKHILTLRERKTIDEMLLRELSLNLKSAEEILRTKYEKHTLDFNFNLNEDVTKQYRDVSEKLKDEERDILMSSIAWSQDDVIKACIEADKSLLLLGLECKHVEMTQDRISADKFLTLTGEIVGKDLLKMYTQIAEHKKEKKKEEKRKELKLQLLEQLKSKSKSPEEIVFSYAKSFTFGCFIETEEKPLSVYYPATFFVEQMAQKGKGLILFLNEDERKQLLSICTWNEPDIIKECFKEDIRLLLPGVLCKVMEREERIVLPDEVIIRIQEETKRTDLLGLFSQLKPDENEVQAQIERWNERQKKEAQIMQELSKGKTSAKEVLHRKFKQLTFKLADEIDTGPEFDKLTKLLGDLNKKVNRKEQNKLLELYEWDKNDIIKACITADKKLLFEGIWFKDMEITQTIIPLDRYVSFICKAIKRTDIFEQFMEDVKILSIDEKQLHHVIEKIAKYFFNAPNVQNVFQKN